MRRLLSFYVVAAWLAVAASCSSGSSTEGPAGGASVSGAGTTGASGTGGAGGTGASGMGGGAGTGGDGKCNSPDIARYEHPGCGTQAQAELVCGSPGMLGCFRGYICNCDGTIRGFCELWSEKPWAYYAPHLIVGDKTRNYFPDNPTSCDPNKPPPVDGGSTDGNGGG
jgi:hypothetical protein